MHFRSAEGSPRPRASARVRPDRANGGVLFDGFIPRARLEELSRTGSAHLRPIYGAMVAPGIGFLMVQQNASRFAIESKGGFVALILDDTDRALGPSGFHRKSVRRLASQVHSITVLSADIEPSIYASAATLAALGRNVLIVETRPEEEVAWMDLLKAAAPRAPILLCTPIAGNA